MHNQDQEPEPRPVLAVPEFPVPDWPFALGHEFWDRVKILGPNDCWLRETNEPNGYFMVSVDGTKHTAPRLVLSNKMGRVLRSRDEGKDKAEVVRHSCNHKLCVNPHHLSVGTYKQNSEDDVLSGRTATRKRRTRITKEIRLGVHADIRAGMSAVEVAKKYDIHLTTLAGILGRKRRPK